MTTDSDVSQPTVGWLTEVADGVLEAVTNTEFGTWCVATIDDISIPDPADFMLSSVELGRTMRLHLRSSADTFVAAVAGVDIRPLAMSAVVLIRDALLVSDPRSPSDAVVTDRMDVAAALERGGRFVRARLAYLLPADEGQAPVIRVRTVGNAGDVRSRWQHLTHGESELAGLFPWLSALARGTSGLGSQRLPGQFNSAVAAALYETASEAAGFGHLGSRVHGYVGECDSVIRGSWSSLMDRIGQISTWTSWRDLQADLAKDPSERCLAPWLLNIPDIRDPDLMRVLSQWALPDLDTARTWFRGHAGSAQRRDFRRAMRQVGWLRAAL